MGVCVDAGAARHRFPVRYPYQYGYHVRVRLGEVPAPRGTHVDACVWAWYPGVWQHGDAVAGASVVQAFLPDDFTAFDTQTWEDVYVDNGVPAG